MKEQISRKSLVLTVVFVILVGSFIVGYIFLESNIDPRSSINGYRIYIGETDGFPISFSYPDSWKRSAISSNSSEKRTELRSQNHTVSISSKVRNDESVNAAAIIQKYIDRNKMRPEFWIIHQNNISLGNEQAQDLFITYRVIFDDYEEGRYIDKPFFERVIAADYQGHTYKIYAPMNLEEYESTNNVIDNVIKTFEFID